MLGVALGRWEVMTERQLSPQGDSDMGDVHGERVKGGRVNECFAVLGYEFVVKILCPIINVVVKDCCRSCCM